MPNIVLPSIVKSSTGGEILPRVPKERNTELRVYTKKKNHQKSREPTIPSAQVQSDALGNEPGKSSSTLDIPLPNIVPSFDALHVPNIVSIPNDLPIVPSPDELPVPNIVYKL